MLLTMRRFLLEKEQPFSSTVEQISTLYCFKPLENDSNPPYVLDYLYSQKNKGTH